MNTNEKNKQRTRKAIMMSEYDKLTDESDAQSQDDLEQLCRRFNLINFL